MGRMKELDTVRIDLMKELYQKENYTCSEIAIIFNISTADAVRTLKDL